MMLQLPLLLLLLAIVVSGKVIILNKPILFKDYPAACQKHNAIPINVRASNVENLLFLLSKVAQKNKVSMRKLKGWIAAFEDSDLTGITMAFGIAEKKDVPSLEILALEDAEKRRVMNISFCWKPDQTPPPPAPAVTKPSAANDSDLHVDTTSPEEDEKKHFAVARKEKSRHRNIQTKKPSEKPTSSSGKKSSEKKSRHHKNISSSSTTTSSSSSSSESSSASSDSEPKKHHRRQKGRKHHRKH